jgi:hypothetical protein
LILALIRCDGAASFCDTAFAGRMADLFAAFDVAFFTLFAVLPDFAVANGPCSLPTVGAGDGRRRFGLHRS